MNDKIALLARELGRKLPSRRKLLIGFDGFVDEIIRCVDRRIDAERYEPIPTIADFARRIGRAAGLSTNVELVPLVRELGGNGPILAAALAPHGFSIEYVGALGLPTPDPLFQIPGNVTLTTLADFAHTDALEFQDGKIQLGKTASLNAITPERLEAVFGKQGWHDRLAEADLFAAVNWSMIPGMTRIWENLLSDHLPALPERQERPVFFVDLADPEKRLPADVRHALGLLKGFRSRFFVVLGLNKKEAYDVSRVLGLFSETATPTLQEVTEALYASLSVDAVVVHPVERSAVATASGYREAEGPYCAHPVITTGAGDTFNGGFLAALLSGLDPESCLLCGMATSGFYVRNGKSPSTNELLAFLTRWAEGGWKGE